MKHILSIFLLSVCLVLPSKEILAEATPLVKTELIAQNDHGDHGHDHHGTHAENGHGEHADDASHDAHADDGHGAHAMPAMWSVIPFVLLLLMIATGPLFYAHFWHKYYPHIAFVLGALIVAYYQFVLHSTGHIVHSFFEYFSFISLLTALFVASGGILINIDKKGKPLTNVMLLVFGAAIANIVGTTGASMLLIRPFMRLNKGRLKAYHVVFFIFMVSNVGGSLTPIGDPPLFLGFLKGVPFEWTILHVWPYWFLGIGLLSAIFFFIDSRNKAEVQGDYTGKISITGAKNVIFLVVTIAAVFIDPNVLDLPSWAYISYHGDKFSYIREIIMLFTAFVAYKASNKEALKGNEFNFEPILEVAFLFVGIFFTMMPALQLISTFASSPDGQALITADSLYWLTGSLSGVLDNAPTYMNFLSAALGKIGLSVSSLDDVHQFVALTDQAGETSFGYLLAISVSSVFFGAMTYIGNAPNFMVKAIAEQNGLEMPAFVTYIVKYSIPILLPVLFITWLVIKYVGL